MWLLTSLGRPDRIRRVVESYVWGGELPVMLTLYEGDERLQDYLAQQWPASWHIEVVPMRGNGPTYNEMLRRYPDESCYGFLADDAILDVQGMLRLLEDEAGDWNVAYANDGLHQDRNATMPCIGGKLVRAVGYLSPPRFMHMALDNVWHSIGLKTDGLRYMPKLTYTHVHPLFGRAGWDKTYLDARNLSIGFEDVYRAWVMNGGLDSVVARAKEKKND